MSADDKLIIVANTISGDEKSWGLYEINEQSPGSRGIHRYQIIQVVRDGQIAEWRKDMGPSRKFKGINQLRIPALLEYTVDELMDIADELRGQTQIDVKDWLELDKFKAT